MDEKTVMSEKNNSFTGQGKKNHYVISVLDTEVFHNEQTSYVTRQNVRSKKILMLLSVVYATLIKLVG